MNKIMLAVVIPLLFVLLLVIPQNADAKHKRDSYNCSISVSSSILPVYYDKEKRGNPDDTFYPGDAFHYLFKFSGSDTCRGFGASVLKSEGAYNVLSHSISHEDLNVMPKYLTTYHWYEIIDVSQKCKTFAGGARYCDDPNYKLGKNVFSYREDKELSFSENKQISYYKKYSNKYQKVQTQAWGLAKIGVTHPHDKGHDYEDESSVNLLESSVNSQCTNLKKNEGCLSGHIEIDTEIVKTKCLIEELEKMGVTNHKLKKENDVCVDVNNYVSLTVKGLKKVCGSSGMGGSIICKTIPVYSTASVKAPILEPGNGINLLQTPLPDTSGYDAKNLDGTYYVHDPLSITHKPDFKWKNQRAKTIQFVTEKTFDLKKEFDYDCVKNNCELFLEKKGVKPHSKEFGNGDGITIYNATSDKFLGSHSFDYFMDVYNVDRKINSLSGNTNSLVVRYDPQYTNYPYPRIADDKRYGFDDRQAAALHYFGSKGGGPDDVLGIHEERRSLINGVHQFGVVFDPWDPIRINQTFAWSGAEDAGIIPQRDTILKQDTIPSKKENSKIIPFETYGNDAMFVKSGYGKVFYDYPLSPVIFDNKTGKPKYENATSYVTLKSNDFAGKPITFLTFWEYVSTESPFVTNFVIKTINQNGTVMDNPIRVTAVPQSDAGAMYLTEYLDEKIIHDSKDLGLAKVIVDDAYTMEFDHISSSGIINEKLRRTSSQFQMFENISGDTSSEKGGIFQISEDYLKNSKELRLQIPIEVGLLALSPTDIIVDVNGMTKVIDAKFLDFSTDKEISINIENDNVLKTKRGVGFLNLIYDENFGGIEKISVNDSIMEPSCQAGCTIPIHKTSPISVVAWNQWGGTAHAELPEYAITEIPKTSMSQLSPVLVLLVLLLSSYVVYRKLHS